MPSPRTFADVFRAAEVEMLQRNGRLRRAVIERDGTDVNLIVAGIAGGGDEVSGQNQLAMATLFLDSAQDEDLDRLLFDRYGLLRKQAAPSVGFVEFSTVALNPTAFTIPVGTLLSTGDNIQFSVVASATFPAASIGPVSVLVQSTEAGLSQQARIGTITSVTSAIVGAPTDLQVTNATATAGAADKENDNSFRERGRQFFTTTAKGTKKAIETAALGIAGVETAIAFEGLEFEGNAARYVELIISDQFTELLLSVDPTPATYQAQAQALAVLVSNSLEDTRAYGISVTVYVAQVVLQPVVLSLSFLANVNTFTVSTRARNAIVSYVNTLRPGESLTIANMVNTLKQVSGLFITGNEITSPVGTIIPSKLQVIRAALALVSLGS